MPGPSDEELSSAAMRVLEMFAAVCGAPDDPQTAQEADEALWRLEGLLAGAGNQ